MKRLFKFFTLLFLCFHIGMAQENSRKHKVTSGETIFSIAKKYNITPYDILQSNPEASKGLKQDDVLIIPDPPVRGVKVKSDSGSSNASKASSSISYTVKKGDTKFSISQYFNITVSDLESQNPEIASGLEEGQVLSILKRNSSDGKTQQNAHNSPSNSEKPITHLVVAGETYFAISRLYGISVNQLLNANNRSTSDILVTGETLKIPGGKKVAHIPTSEEKKTAPISENVKPENIQSDKTYVIKSGDTKFGIAKRLDISIAELERENPHIVKMLVVGQTISIPTSDKNTVAQDDQQPEPVAPANVEKSIVVEASKPEVAPTEKIEEKTEVQPEQKAAPAVQTPVKKAKKEPRKPVDRKSQKTQPSPQEAVAEKPVVAEKQVEEVVVSEKTPTIEDKADALKSEETVYASYVIQPKETVFGLAKTAGMTVDDFLNLNPELKTSIHPGMIIKMPKATLNLSNVNPSGYKNLISTADKSSSKQLLFFLPFSQKEYDTFASNGFNYESINDDFKRAHLEFYRGANLAIDSLRKLNLNIKFDIVEVANPQPTTKVKPVIKNTGIKDYDAIIMPFFDNMEEEVASLTASKEIPVITASPIAYQSNTNNLYSALPSINKQREKVLNYMASKQAHIIVLSDLNRVESRNFIQTQNVKADIIELKKNGGFSEEELVSKLKKNQLNFVVLDSDRNSVFLNATTILLGQVSKYKIQLAVLESGLIPEGGDVSKKRYSILNMVFPSLIPAKSTENSKHFLSIYQKNNNLLPTANVMLGFDITFDSFLRLMQPQSFENSARTDTTEYTQLKFDYKKNSKGGYSNDGIYILQYDADANIREAN